jgi:hypothetical protein
LLTRVALTAAIVLTVDGAAVGLTPRAALASTPTESGATAATADAVPASSTVEPQASSGTVTAQSTVATVTTYSEASSRVAYHGTWLSASSSRYIGGRVKYAKARSASASFSFTGTKVSWIGPVGPTRGKANVYVDGKYVRSVNAYARTFVAQKVLFGFSWSSQGAHTLKIIVAGTAGHPLVAIDAFKVTSLVTVASPAPTPPTTTLPAFPSTTTLRYLATPSVSRPGYLSPITDPVLGTKTTRVSDTAGVRHAYSRISAWNSDGTRILLGFAYPGRMLDGRTYADRGAFHQLSQAIWSNVDPNKLYGIVSNALYRQSASTEAITKLHTFTGYSNLTIGDYEGGISDDDRYMALIGTSSTGTTHLITYNVAAGSVVADIAVPSDINNAQISRKGNYVVVVNDNIGTARGQGVERYTRDLSSRINLTPYGRHGDNALDASGREIYVANNAPNVVAYNLATGGGTRLLAGTTAYEYGHVSGRNLDRPGWIYLSVFDNGATAGRPGHDQVVAVKTDGSGQVEVFAFSHHTDTAYADQPQAVPSPDGRRVLFASEWGGSGVYAYIASR